MLPDITRMLPDITPMLPDIMKGWIQKEQSGIRTLWCCVNRNNFEPFKIRIQTSADIDDLKLDINAKCNPGGAVVYLVLWKVGICALAASGADPEQFSKSILSNPHDAVE
jgi:hypothetical protein